MARELIEHVNPDDLIIVGLDTDDGSEHPLFDVRIYRELKEPFVRNIMLNGILNPVLVRREAGKTYVVDGRQRVRAARRAKELAGPDEYTPVVPIREQNADDRRIQGIMVSVNEQRADDDVLAKAIKAERLLRLTGDIEEVGIHFGRTPVTIRNWLALLKADVKVHDAVRAGKLSATAACKLAQTADRAEQRQVLAKLLSGEDEQKPVTEAAVAAATGTGAQPTKAKAGGAKARQRGVKRVWLRKALKTDAAQHLEPEQHAVLVWFATGEAAHDTWFSDFVHDAQAELEGGTE